jgi:hypothetical protein
MQPAEALGNIKRGGVSEAISAPDVARWLQSPTAETRERTAAEILDEWEAEGEWDGPPLVGDCEALSRGLYGGE